MATTATRLAEINKQLAILPEDKLDEVINFVGFILSKERHKKRRVVQIEGIWEGKGFEKLNIKKELKSNRKALAKSLLKRKG